MRHISILITLLAASVMAYSCPVVIDRNDNGVYSDCLTVRATKAGTFIISGNLHLNGELTVSLEHPDAVVQFPRLFAVYNNVVVKGRAGATTAEGKVDFGSLIMVKGIFISGGNDVTFPMVVSFGGSQLDVTGRVGRVYFPQLLTVTPSVFVSAHTEDGIYLPKLSTLKSTLDVVPVSGATSRVNFGSTGDGS